MSLEILNNWDLYLIMSNVWINLFLFVPIDELLAGVDEVKAVDVEVVLAVEGGRGDERDLVGHDAGDGDVDGEPPAFFVALWSAIQISLLDSQNNLQ